MIYGIVMGCQMAFLRTLRRSFATWDRVIAQPSTPEKNDEATLRIQPAPSQPNLSTNNWTAMRGQTSTFQPEGRGSNFQRDVGGRFASLPRIHRPAPPPPVAPYRSFRVKGRRQVQNSLPAIEAFNLSDMEDDVGETQLWTSFSIWRHLMLLFFTLVFFQAYLLIFCPTKNLPT